MEDNKIIELYFQRDENAIKATEEKYGNLCYSVAYNILCDSGDSEECTNDTYLSLWNTIPPEKPNNFKAFICKIARNLSLKRVEYNSAKKRSRHLEVSLSELEEFLPDNQLRYEIEDESLGELINSFLLTEKEDARNVFIRRYFFHDGISEISSMYCFTSVKVKSMLFHTRHRLKKFLVEKGVYL